MESQTLKTCELSCQQNEKHTLTQDQKFKVIKCLAKSKFPVFLVYSAKLKRKFALKVFFNSGDHLNHHFINESRFKSLHHENIISIIDTREHQLALYGKKVLDSSTILMELCLFDIGQLHERFKIRRDKRLARTSFSQVLEGLTYMHKHGYAHLDLKFENLLLGSDFKVKITDFDAGYIVGDDKVLSLGSLNFRAPEVIEKKCLDPFKADIFSLGILLFIFNIGYLPFHESDLIGGYDLYDLLLNDIQKFWIACEDVQSSSIEDEEFKILFESLTNKVTEKRASLGNVKRSKWLEGEIYSPEAMKVLMEKIFPNHQL